MPPLQVTPAQQKRKRLVRIDLSPQWNFFQSLSSVPWRTIAEALRRIQTAFDSLLAEEPALPGAFQPREIYANFGLVETIVVGTDVTPRIELAIRLKPGETARPVRAFINAREVPEGSDLIVDLLYSTDPFDTDPLLREWFPIFPALNQTEINAGLLDVNTYKLILPEGQEIREFPVVKFTNPDLNDNNPAPLLDLPFSTLIRCDVLVAAGGTAVVKLVLAIRPATEGVPT
jgi:hypothetical protein